MSSVNGPTLAKSRKLLQDIVRKDLSKGGSLYKVLEETGLKLLEEAASLRSGWLGFTGNLPTSYAMGIWGYGGDGPDVYFIGDIDEHYARPTIRQKLQNGERAYLKVPWEGRKRYRVGKVDIHIPEGKQFSYWFLTEQYKPDYYPCIVICTGAEYSVYLQNQKNKEVLNKAGDKILVERVFNGSMASYKFNP